MKNPLVSMIIAVYNGEQYIEECSSSLVTQSYKSLEIVAADVSKH
ncbi:MAG: glycosyltransferase [Nanoarchaeota archaeon]|nr:glycosyltransferase [Nanoarchaeota archaeon]